MSDEQAWADLGVGVEVDLRHHLKQLSYDAEPQPCRRPKPSGSTPPNHLFEPVEGKRPKSLRPPTGVPVRSETRQVRSACSPRAITCPRLDCVSVVFHLFDKTTRVRELCARWPYWQVRSPSPENCRSLTLKVNVKVCIASSQGRTMGSRLPKHRLGHAVGTSGTRSACFWPMGPARLAQLRRAHIPSWRWRSASTPAS